jgi:sugar phosphate isomerase/epimerase
MLNKNMIRRLWACCFLLYISVALSAQKSQDWELAMHGFTFRYSTFTEVLNKSKALGVNQIEVYFGQLLGEGFPEGEKIHYRTITPEISKKIKALLKEKEMKIVSAGVVRPGDETDWRKLFAFAKEFGLLVINAEPPSPSVQTFEMIDRLADEYDVNVAIHNHKAPSTYWYPKIIDDFIKNSNSTHIGINADLGHWVRSGLDPLECIKNYKGRIMSIHMKDIDEKFHDCVWGAGICSLNEVLHELKQQQFKGVFTIEYESKSPSLNEELEESLSFFRKQVKELF